MALGVLFKAVNGLLFTAMAMAAVWFDGNLAYQVGNLGIYLAPDFPTVWLAIAWPFGAVWVFTLLAIPLTMTLKGRSGPVIPGSALGLANILMILGTAAFGLLLLWASTSSIGEISSPRRNFSGQVMYWLPFSCLLFLTIEMLILSGVRHRSWLTRRRLIGGVVVTSTLWLVALTIIVVRVVGLPDS